MSEAAPVSRWQRVFLFHLLGIEESVGVLKEWLLIVIWHKNFIFNVVNSKHTASNYSFGSLKIQAVAHISS